MARAALDVAVLLALWMGLHLLGPLSPSVMQWLNEVSLVAEPWIVHVLLLLKLFHVAPPETHGTGWLVRSIVFTLLSALLIPMLAITAFFFIVMPLFLLVFGERHQRPFSHPIWHDKVYDDIFPILIAAAVGAAIGLLLHIPRRGGQSDGAVPNEPRLRTDVLGGSLAAGLLYVGLFFGRALGWFTSSIDLLEGWTASMTLSAHLAAIVVIVSLAMLPHVIMVGRKLLVRPTRTRL